MAKKLAFIWPQEPYLPSSLFKHYTYLGEAAGYARINASVQLLDLSVKPATRKEVCDLAQESDFVLIPVEAYTAEASTELVSLVKQVGNAITVAYGSAPSINPTLFAKYFDVVVANGHWESIIDQIVSGQAVTSGVKFGVPINTNSWVYPPLDILPLAEYLAISPGQLELCVQKGCVHNCSFCGEKRLFPETNIYPRSPENISSFVKANPNYSFYIDATTFTQDRKWAKEVCRELSNLDPVPVWKTVTRIDQLDEEIVILMAEAGCTKVGLGVETLSPKLQKDIRKPISESRLIQGVELLQKYNIIPRLFMILGLPGQEGEDILYTQRFIEGLKAEYRWKEFVPLSKITDFDNIGQFVPFRRGNFHFHEIPGLNREDYLKLLSINR